MRRVVLEDHHIGTKSCAQVWRDRPHRLELSVLYIASLRVGPFAVWTGSRRSIYSGDAKGTLDRGDYKVLWAQCPFSCVMGSKVDMRK